MRVARATVLYAVLVLLVRAQGESAWEFLAADSARVLHLIGVCVRLHLVTHQIRHLIEALAAEITLVRPLVRVREHVITQIAWRGKNSPLIIASSLFIGALPTSNAPLHTFLMESFAAHVTLVRLVLRVRLAMGD